MPGRRLRQTPDGDGSLLDHTLLFYGSGMGNGNAHEGYPLPLVAVGVNRPHGHQHVRLSGQTPIANLWLGVANTFGAPMAGFGDSSGQLEL